MTIPNGLPNDSSLQDKDLLCWSTGWGEYGVSYGLLFSCGTLIIQSTIYWCTYPNMLEVGTYPIGCSHLERIERQLDNNILTSKKVTRVELLARWKRMQKEINDHA